MKVIPYQDVAQTDNLQFQKIMDKGASRVKLSHYTCIKTMKIILKEQTFKLNRIDLVNDLKEREYLKDPKTFSRVFVGCFTHKDTESIPQWYMYTPMYKGVKIEFILDNELNSDLSGIIAQDRKLLVFYDTGKKEFEFRSHLMSTKAVNNESYWNIALSCTDICYSDELMAKNPIHRVFEDKFMVDIIPLAKIKEISWDFETETRIIGMFQTTRSNVELNIPNFMLLPLDYNKLSIRIILNPWATRELKSEVESFCSTFLKGYRYTVIDSSLLNTLSDRKW